MDNETFEAGVRERMESVIKEEFGGSVNAASKASAIPYASLDRKLKTPSLLTVAELRRFASASGRAARSLLPSEDTTTALAAEGRKTA